MGRTQLQIYTSDIKSYALCTDGENTTSDLLTCAELFLKFRNFVLFLKIEENSLHGTAVVKGMLHYSVLI
jgi:hypothetical protein